MKLRSLILATIVLLGLAGTLYWSEHRKPADDTKSSPDSPAILRLEQGSITKLAFKKKDAEPIVLTRNSAGEWQITEPKPYGADQTAVSSTLSLLTSLTSQRMVDDKASDIKQYGLDPPTAEVDLTEKDNKSHKLLMGDDTPSGSSTYVMLAGDLRVFTIPSYNRNLLVKGVNELRDKRLLPIEASQVSRLDLVRKNRTIEFGRNKDEWQVLQPQIPRSDSTGIGDLVDKLTVAKMELTGPDSDPKEAAQAFAHATPVATARVTTPAGTHELQVRKSKDAYYAKSTAVEGVYKVAANLAEMLDKGAEDFRNKKLFDFAFSDPNKVELKIGPKNYALTRNVHDWLSDGKQMDVNGVGLLLSDIRDLAADKFVDSGFANPTIDVTVTSDDGKRIEKVSFAKTGDGYVAKRENDPTLYHLAAGPVDSLQEAADGLKPAPKK